MTPRNPIEWLDNATHTQVATSRCRQCKAWTVLADNTHLDPTPLTAAGEAIAILNGHATYQISRLLQPQRRAARHITEHPAGTFKLPTDIYPTHICHVTDEYPSTESQLERAFRQEDPKDPPY